MPNTTYDLARRNGAGVILTDDTVRYKVSDWSNGTRDVYGRPGKPGAWGEYQKLPTNLCRDDDPEADLSEKLDDARDTFHLAREHGAGVILTDGRRRYKVSDWSESDGTVNGHIQVGDQWAAYQNLPDNLTLVEEIATLYARSEHKAPAGSPAELAILDEMERDQGAEYGETADPVLRARRRMRGKDGLRDDIHDMMKPLQDQVWEIAQQARVIAANMVRIRLRRLEEALPRHRFTAFSAHLTSYKLEVDPPLRHFGPHPISDIDRLVDKDGWLRRPDYPLQDLAAFIHDQSEQISTIMIRFADEFHVDIGAVTTDENHDIDTDYGFRPTHIPEDEEA